MTDSQDRRHSGSRDSSEFQQAIDRLEKAVQGVVGSATSEFADRATSFLNETTARFEREYGQYGDEEDLYDPEARSQRHSSAERMAARRRARWQSQRSTGRSARLYRDVENEKIAGVCAGIARYYGMETWVVRCMAVTGLLFFPSIVFPAYWIMYFVMGTPPKAEGGSGRKGGSRRAWAERGNRIQGGRAAEKFEDAGSTPRYRLRNVQADFAEIELKLRRMESHVTSGQYELQRELNRIEAEPPAASGSDQRSADVAGSGPDRR
ncbi:MAG: PspC domain-containing protein [Pseudomonadales bacterium]